MKSGLCAGGLNDEGSMSSGWMARHEVRESDEWVRTLINSKNPSVHGFPVAADIEVLPLDKSLHRLRVSRYLRHA
jgi:hypothetical protein